MPPREVKKAANATASTATNICGPDLHIYEGRNPLEEGQAIGHENLGEVIEVGEFFTKGQFMGTGQANVKAYNRELRDLIHDGKASPSWVVSHHLSLEEGPDAYGHFDDRDDGWTKVVLHP